MCIDNREDILESIRERYINTYYHIYLMADRYLQLQYTIDKEEEWG